MGHRFIGPGELRRFIRHKSADLSEAQAICGVGILTMRFF